VLSLGTIAPRTNDPPVNDREYLSVFLLGIAFGRLGGGRNAILISNLFENVGPNTSTNFVTRTDSGRHDYFSNRKYYEKK
jgi:hypothetical protein